jgi:hypothetical protein
VITGEEEQVVRAIHLLLGNMHLARAGVRALPIEERRLVDDLCEWYEVAKDLMADSPSAEGGTRD